MVALDDGTRVLPAYVNCANYDYANPRKGTLHSWDSGAKPTQRSTWQRLEHVFEGSGPGVRRAVVVLQSRDSQFWAGHDGGKFMAPQLRFVPPAGPEP